MAEEITIDSPDIPMHFFSVTDPAALQQAALGLQSSSVKKFWDTLLKAGCCTKPNFVWEI